MRTYRWIGLGLALAGLALGGCRDHPARVMPLTTSSDEALAFFEEAREAMDELQPRKAHVLFSRAVRADPEFALAHLGVAETAPTEEQVRSSLARALTLTGLSMSEGERLLIRAFNAGREHDLRAEFDYVRQAARRYPHDERAQVKLGDFYMRQKNYDEAIRSYEKALTLAEDYSAPRQRLGQADRVLGRYDVAELE